jgi:glycosyltransferase involved in cell wall biosynthesis
MRKLFVLIPSLHATGPIKGAIALCNALADSFDVTLVPLKQSPAYPGQIDARVRVLELGSLRGWRARLPAYRKMLAAEPERVLSLSCCFSADIFNVLVRKHAVTISSLRGHLLRTYRIDYGPTGSALAILHFLALRRLNCVVAMTSRMADQFAAIARKRPVVIGNFVEEDKLEQFRAPSFEPSPLRRFVFVGRLDPLKEPRLAIDAICTLADQGVRCRLDLYGDGPLMRGLQAWVVGNGRGGIVHFHGHVENPWTEAARAHCMVLPSRTEGVSRAALEALYLGVPCVMRDVDSNADLIEAGRNGFLFDHAGKLASAMYEGANLGRRLALSRPVLLDRAFRQATCIDSYRTLLKAI